MPFYNANQVKDLITHSLKGTTKTGGTALWYDPNENIHPKLNLPKVWWAEDDATPNSPYSATVNLLQYLLSKLKAEEIKKGVFYRSGIGRHTPMCDGMMRFFGFSWGHQNTNLAIPGGVVTVVGHTTSPQMYPGDKVDGLAMKDRKELDAFALPNTVTLPHVDVTRQDYLENHQGFHTIHRIYMMAAYALVSKRFESSKTPGHNIGAILVDSNGHILSWGLNTRWDHPTWHAEVNMLQSYFKRNKNAPSIPAGARIYTTLKPCAMCAGMIHEAAANVGGIKVYYGQADTGSHATNTALDAVPTAQQLLSHSQHESHYYYQGDNAHKPRNPATMESEPDCLAYLITKHLPPHKSPKPINIDQGKDHGEDMSFFMESKWENNNSNFLSEFLKGNESVDAMKRATDKLVQKVKKYDEGSKMPFFGMFLNPNVSAALRNVLPLLRAQNIKGF